MNTLSDPSLHFLAVVLVLICLTLGGSWSQPPVAETPLGYCKTCNVHFLPEKSCNCPLSRKIASALP